MAHARTIPINPDVWCRMPVKSQWHAHRLTVWIQSFADQCKISNGAIGAG
jgi:hypothetical protein